MRGCEKIIFIASLCRKISFFAVPISRTYLICITDICTYRQKRRKGDTYSLLLYTISSFNSTQILIINLHYLLQKYLFLHTNMLMTLLLHKYICSKLYVMYISVFDPFTLRIAESETLYKIKKLSRINLQNSFFMSLTYLSSLKYESPSEAGG